MEVAKYGHPSISIAGARQQNDHFMYVHILNNL